MHHRLVVRPYTPGDRAEWRRMRLALWPDSDAGDEGDMREWLERPDAVVLVAERPGGGLAGFAEAGERPYADGCDTSPVAYLEGWFVDADLRARGIGRALVDAVERWAASRGRSELASDALLDNVVSHRAHAALGFAEVERLVLYRKALRPEAPAGEAPGGEGRAGGREPGLPSRAATRSAEARPIAMLPDADRLPTLDTDRLRLRWLTPADVPALFAIFGDPEVCRYWGRATLPAIAAAADLQREIAQSFAARSLFQWGIAERATDAVVGTCTLAALSLEHRRAELGFALARSAWGRGYVAEVLPALLDFAFGTLGLHRLEADVDPRNARSIRALERAGFRREGYARERHLLDGELQDAVLYGLLRHEWRPDARADA